MTYRTSDEPRCATCGRTFRTDELELDVDGTAHCVSCKNRRDRDVADDRFEPSTHAEKRRGIAMGLIAAAIAIGFGLWVAVPKLQTSARIARMRECQAELEGRITPFRAKMATWALAEDRACDDAVLRS